MLPTLGGEALAFDVRVRPTDPSNKARLDRTEHIQLVRWWNSLLRDVRPQ